MFRRIVIVCITLILGSWMGCDKRPTPFAPTNEGNYLPAPKNLRATVSDRQVRLEWDVDDSSQVRLYHIYRWKKTEAPPTLADSTANNSYTDRQLVNGQTYVYRVFSVDVQGFESLPSQDVEATPNIYSLVIEDGREYANRTSVTLRFTVPQGVTLMSISNDSLFAEAYWQPFSSQTTWSMPEGDGTKHVYAKFRDAQGQENHNLAMDSIVLDTKAVIREVTEDTQGRILTANSKIHFTIVTDEPLGRARVDIGDGSTAIYRADIVLFDDGTNGDAVSGDGTYEVTYLVPQGLEVISVPIVGRFSDRAGNVADVVTAAGRVTIRQPPAAVTLLEPSPTGLPSSSLEVSWSISNDTDFSRYKLYRSTEPAVGVASTLVKTIETRATTWYVDSGLSANTTYYYRLYVFDTSGLSSPSNLVSGRTAENDPPLPVALSRPTVVDSATLRLSWTRSSEPDFESYRIYRSDSSPVDTTIAPIAILNGDPNLTQYDDSGLTENFTYFYRVFVHDQGGLFVGSNEVQGKIPRR